MHSLAEFWTSESLDGPNPIYLDSSRQLTLPSEIFAMSKRPPFLVAGERMRPVLEEAAHRVPVPMQGRQGQGCSTVVSRRRVRSELIRNPEPLGPPSTARTSARRFKSRAHTFKHA